jgi:hypothetical protein
VATEADYPALEAAYVAARAEPGAPVLVKVEGRVTERPKPKGDGSEAMLVEASRMKGYAAIVRGEDHAGRSAGGRRWRRRRRRG